jgi:hypothetical protein
VLFTEEAIFTACHGGQIKCWARPSTQAKPGDAPAGGGAGLSAAAAGLGL